MVLDTHVTKQACITLIKSKNKTKNGEKATLKNQIAIDTKKSSNTSTHEYPKDQDMILEMPYLLLRKIKKYNPVGFSLDKALR